MYTRRLLISAVIAMSVVSTPLSHANASVVCAPLPHLLPEVASRDLEQEQAFCDIDFESSSIALCPKTWSTSPAALVYDVNGTQWEGRREAFETALCADGGRARDAANIELAFFKNTLNGRETSGTFAPASLLYYHFSRLLQTRLHVPVAVPVSFPAQAYRQRIVVPGLAFTEGDRTKMLHEGWLEMDRALAAPAQYRYRRELFEEEGSRLWGVLLLGAGKRYGPELNGTRASGWGEGQNRDFQRTAPFIALRTDASLAEAVATGISVAREDAKMAKAVPVDFSPEQVAWWMHELTELVLLDFILGQQDRIGNVDYNWRWVWQQDGALRTAAIDPQNGALRMRVTALNDNDAGVRRGYANYARSTGMLDDWRHMDAALYTRVQRLARDLRESGAIATAIKNHYRLASGEADGIIERAIVAADVLRQRCESGLLRFDLDVASVLDPASAAPAKVACSVN